MEDSAMSKKQPGKDNPKPFTPEWFQAKIINPFLTKLRDPEFHKQVAASLGSIVLAMLIATVVMIMAGYNAGLAFIALIRGAILSWDRVLFRATPLIFTGLSVALAFKSGLFNIGPEGQVFIGAMAATVVGYMIALPIVIHPIASLFVAGLMGGIWGFVPGLLKAYRGAHEVVTTMMLSYTAILLTHYLVAGPFLEPGNEYILQTPPIFGSAELPKLTGSFLSWAFLVGILAVIAVDFLINRTVLGYEMRAVGLNKDAAEYAGINSKRTMALSLGLAGALAGMGGAGEILGYHHRFIDNWSSGLGWDGITVAVLGGNNPWGVLVGAIFFGALKTGGNSMQRIAGVPSEMVSVIQGLIVVFVAAPRIINWISERGGEEFNWLKRSPREGGPHFITLGVTLVASILGLSLLGSISHTSMMAGIVVFVASLIGIVAFVFMFSRELRGLQLAILSGILWFVATPIGFMVGNTSLLLSSLILGAIMTVFGLVTMIGYKSQLEGDS